MNDVFDKVLIKSSSKLLEEFDARYADKEAKRQLEIENLKTEVATLSTQLDSNQKSYDERIQKNENERCWFKFSATLVASYQLFRTMSDWLWWRDFQKLMSSWTRSLTGMQAWKVV